MEAKQIIIQSYEHQSFLLKEIERVQGKTLERIFFETREFLITIRKWHKEDEILANCLLEIESFKKEFSENNFYTRLRIRESISLKDLRIALQKKK